MNNRLNSSYTIQRYIGIKYRFFPVDIAKSCVGQHAMIQSNMCTTSYVSWIRSRRYLIFKTISLKPKTYYLHETTRWYELATLACEHRIRGVTDTIEDTQRKWRLTDIALSAVTLVIEHINIVRDLEFKTYIVSIESYELDICRTCIVH